MCTGPSPTGGGPVPFRGGREPSRYAHRVLARVWHGAIAVLAVAALSLQLWVAVHVPGTPPGTDVGRLAGATFFGRVLRVLSFFTIQSNILSAITSAQLSRDPNRDGALWRTEPQDRKGQ